jgi:hypothetical protein
MSKSAATFNRASRPPVDALQYEKLAFSALELCERQGSQLVKLVALAASIHMTPALTADQRHSQRNLLELFVDTAEDYQRTQECEVELFQVIALNVKGFTEGRLTASEAIELLTEARTQAISASH